MLEGAADPNIRHGETPLHKLVTDLYVTVGLALCDIDWKAERMRTSGQLRQTPLHKLMPTGWAFMRGNAVAC